jgi:hypothetical protein
MLVRGHMSRACQTHRIIGLVQMHESSAPFGGFHTSIVPEYGSEPAFDFHLPDQKRHIQSARSKESAFQCDCGIFKGCATSASLPTVGKEYRIVYSIIPTNRNGKRTPKEFEVQFGGTLRTMLIFVIEGTLFSLLALSASFADLPYLHDRTASILYGPAYRALFEDAPTVPSWLKTYNSTQNGVEMPGTRVFLDGSLFERYKVCETQDCNGAYIVVLFTPGGRQAWAISVLDGQPPVFFGHPDPAIKKVLISAVKKP